MEISDLPDKEFNVMVLKDSHWIWEKNGGTQWELRQRVRNCKGELIIDEEYNVWKENALQGISSRLDDTEECINDLEDRVVEIN